jgi:hypothetical protein
MGHDNWLAEPWDTQLLMTMPAAACSELTAPTLLEIHICAELRTRPMHFVQGGAQRDYGRQAVLMPGTGNG